MVDVIGRAKVIVQSDVDSTSVGETGGKIGSAVKTGAAVGVAALGTLAVAGVKAFQAFEDAEAQSRKLNQVLTNMGEGQATEAVEGLADELMRLTGIDDEVIKGGQTLLATFDSVNDSAGELGGTFDRATRLSLDMSTVFGSVESASRTLGKALEDPEKAAQLLRRANVFLNDEQKSLIDSFLAAGDAAGAQDVILDALEERYKGTAETAATESQKISAAMDEIQEAIGNALSELTDGEVGSFSDALFGLSDQINRLAESDDWQEFGDNMAHIVEVGGDLADVLSDVYVGGSKVNDALPDWADNWRLIPGPIGEVLDKLDDLYELYKDVKELFEDDIDITGLEDVRSILGDISTTIDGIDSGGGLNSDFISDITGKAVGGPASGWTLVGERGPEIVDLPNGSYVHNTPATSAIVSAMAGQGSGGDTLIINLNGPSSLSAARVEQTVANTYGTRFGG